MIAQAREAEAAGFDAVFVMDHFYQLPGIGRPDQPMLESYTALGALATATERVQLSTLVTGNTYRNPTLLAKAVTTLDVVSGGRAVLGIGAGWFELEHRQLGFEFGTFTERFARLDEALQIIEPMLRGERPDVDGAWYHAENAINEPRSATTCRSCSAAAGRGRRWARRALRRPPQHHLRPRGPSPQAGGARPALRRGRPGPPEHRDQHARLPDGGRGR